MKQIIHRVRMVLSSRYRRAQSRFEATRLLFAILQVPPRRAEIEDKPVSQKHLDRIKADYASMMANE